MKDLTPGDLTVRRAQPEDKGELLGLVAESFGEDASVWNESYWCWKHELNPFGPSYALVAEAGGRPVGLRMFLRWRLESGATSVEAVRAVDTVTHPDFRRRGIFSRLTREALRLAGEDGVRLVFNTPNPRSRAGYLQMGWQDVGRVPLMLCPLRPLRLLLPDAAAPEPDLKAFPTAGDLLASGPEPERFRIDDRRLHTRRTRSYLDWRYRQIPDRHYHALWERRGTGAAALCFHGRRRRGRREVTLSEVLLTPDRSGRRLARELLDRLVREVDADHLVAVAAAGTPERRVLGRAGFLPVPFAGPRLTVHLLSSESTPPHSTPASPLPVDPCSRESWRPGIGDLEIF